ncbi:hypothetical protein M3Y99_01171600 [Aphelenchoides fujianensis]|nr:hypothetical protein M3Y99_01171600 [Aphelenchoides fujianensis]
MNPSLLLVHFFCFCTLLVVHAANKTEITKQTTVVHVQSRPLKTKSAGKIAPLHKVKLHYTSTFFHASSAEFHDHPCAFLHDPSSSFFLEHSSPGFNDKIPVFYSNTRQAHESESSVRESPRRS